ncbi:hypothetical protein AgCh_035159 [Apium graveolens]
MSSAAESNDYDSKKAHDSYTATATKDLGTVSKEQPHTPELSETFNNMSTLRFFDLDNVNFIGSFKQAFKDLRELLDLLLGFNIFLDNFPYNICNSRTPTNLKISGCIDLRTLPIDLGNIGSLVELYAEQLAIVKLPDSIGHLTKLVVLRLAVPTKMFALRDGAAARNNNILGIHLQYKTEITVIDEYNSTPVDVENEEILHPSKLLKHMKSDNN